jgi:DNA-binding CsgD family transcriptional regulator
VGTRNALSVVESAYATIDDDRAWLDGIAAAVAPDLAQGMGMCAYIYDASRIPVVVHDYVARDTTLTKEHVAGAVTHAAEDYVNRTWRTIPVAVASETSMADELTPIFEQFFSPLGIRDFVGLNGYDASGVGVWVGAPLPKEATIPAPARRTWARVAAHLAAALRLRRRPARTHAAVLSPSGRLEHAEGDATNDAARAALREAVVRVERARGAMRTRDPDDAVASWTALVEARWTLLDTFERDGRRYIVAVENPPVAPGPEILARRERQVLAAAALGRSNKLVAYELGLSDSTVRVLLARAAKKLAVDTRAELIALYLAHTRR